MEHKGSHLSTSDQKNLKVLGRVHGGLYFFIVSMGLAYGVIRFLKFENVGFVTNFESSAVYLTFQVLIAVVLFLLMNVVRAIFKLSALPGEKVRKISNFWCMALILSILMVVISSLNLITDESIKSMILVGQLILIALGSPAFD